MDYETSCVIDNYRRFNRFFIQRAGVLDRHFLGTDLSVTEARLLYEIAQREEALATGLQAALGLDAGYLSRILRRFEARGWISRVRGARDGRHRPLSLTAEGRAAFARLDEAQREMVAAIQEQLDPLSWRDLVAALTQARLLMGDSPSRGVALRPFRAGDMGMIVARQSLIYRETYGWGPEIEALEAEVTARFLRNFKPGREQCWIAELDGAMAGAVFLTDEGEGLCRLRLLHVEPFARGRGIGTMLVSTCVSFARMVGYGRITLWTHTILDAARRIYAAHGFRIVDVQMHEDFGMPIQGETWNLDLDPAQQALPEPTEAA